MKTKLLIFITALLVLITIKVNAQIITTFAGTGQQCCFSAEGVQATAAILYSPKGLVIDASGNMYVSDDSHGFVRKINTAGIISIVAGMDDTSGYMGDGGPATKAHLSGPSGMAFDASGNLYIADADNGIIRKVNTAGIISTVAGTPSSLGYGGDGGQATAAKLNYPYSIAFDSGGNLYITDTQNMRIRRVDKSTGIITTYAGNGTGTGTGTGAYSGDGGQATAAELNTPNAICFDSHDNLYISDVKNFRIRKVTTAGIISTAVGIGTYYGATGNGGPATSATINTPVALTFDAQGNLYISDNHNDNIRKVTTAGVISNYAGNGYGSSNAVGSYTGDGGLANAAGLYWPQGIVFDAGGNLYIADYINYVIRKVTPALPGMSVAGSATLCAGATATLTASGATTYTWSPATGLSATTGSMVIANPTVTTTYTVIGTKGDSMSLVTAVVTVNTPTLTINTPTICIGNTGTLTANGATTYTWSTGSTGASLVQSPTVTTIYSVTATNATGCTNANTATITVSSYPVITVNSPTACAGTATTLTASGATTYSWSTGATTATISPSPTVTTSYTVTGKNAGGCATPITTTINVIAKPVITVNSTSLCIGNTATLTASGANTYLWSSNAGSATTVSVAISPTVTTTYSVTGTATTTCKALVTSTVTIVSTPTVNSPNHSYHLCGGDVTTFSVSGAVSYTWTPATFLSDPYSANPLVTPSPANPALYAQTIYTVTGSNGCLPSAPLTQSLVVYATPTVDTVYNQMVCSGTSVAGINFSSTPAGAWSFEWNNSNTNTGIPVYGVGNIAGYQAPTVSTSQLSVITVSPSINGCYGPTRSFTIEVDPLPTFSLTSNLYSLCNGTSQILNASGASSYTWIPANSLSNANTANPTASPSTTTVYSVIGTGACGSLTPATITVTVNNVTTATISQVGCSSITVNAVTYTASGSYTQNLTNAAGCDSILTINATIKIPSTATISPIGCTSVTVNATTYTASGTYAQKFTNSQGCDSTLTINATINIPSTATINPVGCSSITVNATTYTTSGTYTQNFTNSQGCDSTLTINATINIPSTATINLVGCSSITVNATTYTTSGTYVQNLINAQGCDSTITINATINMPTTSTMSPVGCSSLTVNAVTYTATGTYTQSFTNSTGCDSTLIINATINMPTTSTINPVGCTSLMVNAATYTTSGTYIQNLISVGGCDSLLTVNVTLNPVPSVSFTLTADAAPHTWDALPNYSTNVQSVTWYWGDGSSTTGLYPNHTYSVAGTYSICATVTDTAGCTATFCQNDALSRLANNSPLSTLIYVNVLNSNQTTGISRISGLNSTISIYPNPSNGNFIIGTTNAAQQLVEVYDLAGRLVLSQTINGTTTINVNELTAGTYNLKVSGAGVSTNKRVIIAK